MSLDRFDGSTGYYLYDPRGSVTGITNEEGQIYQSYRYSTTGEITFGAPQYENEYTYNGESYNPNIESQYLRARYYCVVTATFLTEDSYLGNINEPLTLNRYNYCASNPVNHIDPSGHIEINIPLEEIQNADTFGEMWDLLIKYSKKEFAKTEAEHGAREEQFKQEFYDSCETPFMQGVYEVESTIGFSGIYNAIVSPLRYAEQGHDHPIIDTFNNRKANSKSFYAGFSTGLFDIVDVIKHPELITSRTYNALFTLIENPDILTTDLMGVASNMWDSIWESEDKDFFEGSGEATFDLATTITLAYTAKCVGANLGKWNKASKNTYYFRGTTEGYAGNSALQRLEITPTSTDPLVSTVFATNGEQYGKGIVYISSANDLKGVSPTASNVLSSYEKEVCFNIQPLEFVNKSTISISASDARAILKDMGYDIPAKITNADMSAFLSNAPTLTEDEILKFVEKARGIQ